MTTTNTPERATARPWHTDKYHLYIWGPQEQMVGDSRLDDAKAECPEETGTPILRARGVGAKLPINANMDFIIEAVNTHDALQAENERLRELVKELPGLFSLMRMSILLLSDATEIAETNGYLPEMCMWKAHIADLRRAHALLTPQEPNNG